MSYVLRLNGEEKARSMLWRPRIFGAITGTSYPEAVGTDYVWEQGGFILAWEVDPPRIPTAEEIAAQEQNNIRQQLTVDAKAAAMFANLRGATFAQISTFVDANFGAMNATQRNFIKLLAASASLYLQER